MLYRRAWKRLSSKVSGKRDRQPVTRGTFMSQSEGAVGKSVLLRFVNLRVDIGGGDLWGAECWGRVTAAGPPGFTVRAEGDDDFGSASGVGGTIKELTVPPEHLFPADSLPLGALDGEQGPRPDYVACLYTSVTYLQSGYPDVTGQGWYDREGTAEELRFPPRSRSYDRLQRSGWATRETRDFIGEGLVWVVTATKGDQTVRGEGATADEAWHRACEQARALGTLS
jgi:hypothetical protein